MRLKPIWSLVFSLSCFFCYGQSTTDWKFDFGSGKVQPGYIQILPETNYNSKTGYGFEFSSSLSSKVYSGKDDLRNDYITSNKPFYFSIKLPEGNYNVKLILGDREATSVTTIKAECRRLMVEKAETAYGEIAAIEFTVHIRDSVIRSDSSSVVRLKPRERIYLHWDNKLTLEFNNTNPKICAVEITAAKNIPTVFLAGNSTVVDQAEEPWAAWGQMIPAFFQPKSWLLPIMRNPEKRSRLLRVNADCKRFGAWQNQVIIYLLSLHTTIKNQEAIIWSLLPRTSKN
jgi:hypothetical protein